MKVEVQKIDAKKASEILCGNTSNYRRIDDHRVMQYMKSMRAGEWELNGETIKIADDGTLIDGQHRLTAVVRSKVPVQMTVASGLKCNGLHIDRGKPRTISQWLAKEGVKYSTQVAAVAKLCLQHRQGMWGLSSLTSDRILVSDQVVFALDNREEIHKCLQISPHSRAISGARSICASICLEASSHRGIDNCETIKWFMKKLDIGDELSSDEPVYHLRNRIISNTSGRTCTRFHLRMLVTKAWNLTAQGRLCNNLNFRVSGPNREKPIEKILLDDSE